MQGESAYRKAIEDSLDEVPKEQGSYFTASPFRRILIALSGPIMNLLFAFIVFSVIFLVGYSTETWSNRIVVASDYSAVEYPAAAAGLMSGDQIVEIDGRSVTHFSEIQEHIALAGDRPIELLISRDALVIPTTVVPILDKETGSGKIGIYAWIDPIIRTLHSDGPARLAGLEASDRILSVNGHSIQHTVDLYNLLAQSQPERIVVDYQRGETLNTVTLVLVYDGKGTANLGIDWERFTYKIQAADPLDGLRLGWMETRKTVESTIRGILNLFRGVNVLKAVSGPARITWMVGQIASGGFSISIDSGFKQSFSFLAILSIGLFIMNLLPIPILDGGWIVLFIIEAIQKRAIKVRTVLRYQTFGLVAIAALFLLTTISDILFFSGR